jgi:hypothetical protein
MAACLMQATVVVKTRTVVSVVELQSCQELAQCYTSDPFLARMNGAGRAMKLKCNRRTVNKISEA